MRQDFRVWLIGLLARQGIDFFQATINFNDKIGGFGVVIGGKTAQPVEKMGPIGSHKTECLLLLTEDVTVGVVIGGVGVRQARRDLYHLVTLVIGQFGGEVFL